MILDFIWSKQGYLNEDLELNAKFIELKNDTNITVTTQTPVIVWIMDLNICLLICGQKLICLYVAKSSSIKTFHMQNQFVTATFSSQTVLKIRLHMLAVDKM